MSAYYNEIEPYAAAWLRNLIAAGWIAPGDVDERDIRDVKPHELRGYKQCHFFAGIGVWSYALRLAFWPDSRPVWTGSCPCQPFSAAGRRGGAADERHLWPHWQHLIEECRPAVVLGEQVASKDAEPWLDLVQSDMEGMGYAFGAVPVPAAGIGAPHIRDRLWWVADAERGRQDAQQHTGSRYSPSSVRQAGERGGGRATRLLADASSARLEGRDDREVGRQRAAAQRGGRAGGVAYLHIDRCVEARRSVAQVGHDGFVGDGAAGGVADAERHGQHGRRDVGPRRRAQPADSRDAFWTAPLHGFWRDADWLLCRDGKWRPVEPGTFPLAHGAPARVGRLRAYGNAIVAPLAAEFIAAYLEARGEEAMTLDDVLR